MGNISSIFGSSVGKANLSPSSLCRLDNRSNGSSSVYGGGNSSCGVSNASESFIDNSFSNPSDDEDGQINHDNDNHSSNSSYSQEEYEYVHVNEEQPAEKPNEGPWILLRRMAKWIPW